MSPTNKPGNPGSNRPKMDDVSMRAQLTEVAGDLGSPVITDSVNARDATPVSHRGRSWLRAGGIGLLSVGLIAGALLAVRNMNINKQTALNANQAGQSVQIKSQSIGLSSLGLKPIGLLGQQSNALTVNGDLNVAGSVILNPSSAPTGGPVAGQLYYSQQKNQLGYYNGSGFVYLQGGPSGSTTNNVSNVSNVYNVSNVSNVTNISNFTNAVTGPAGVIPMFDGSGLNDSIINETGNGVAVGATANTSTRFTVSGVTSDSTTNALTVTDSTGDVYAQVDDSGQVDLGKGPGAVFGNSTLEASRDSGVNGVMTADKFMTTNSAVVTSMSIYVGGVGAYPYDQYQLAIYADSGGAPGALVATSAVGSLTGNTWNTLPISATLAANTPYWLAYTSSSNASWADDPYYALTASATHAYGSFTFGSGSQSGMPATFPAPTTVNDYTHSIYATTVGSGSAFTLDASGTLTATGNAVFKDVNNNTTAFQVQNSGGVSVMDVDTADGSVGIGTATPGTTRLSIVGATSDNTSSALSAANSIGNTLAQVSDDGSVKLGLSYGVFGNDSSGNYTGAGYYNAGENLMQAQSFTTTSGGALRSISTYIGGAISGTNNLYQMAIYTNSSNAPNTIVAATAVGTLTNSGWNTLPITATLATNTTYWLVYWTNVADTNHNGQNFISGYSGPNTFYQSWATWQSGGTNGMPTTFPAGSGPSSGYETSIYASYASPVSALNIDTSGNLTSNGAVSVQNSSSSALEVADASGGPALNVDAVSKEVAINSANTYGFTLGVSGNEDIVGNNNQALLIQNAGFQPLFTANTNSLAITISGIGTTFATLVLQNTHLSSTQTTAPTYSTPINCGTSPAATVTAGSTDTAGSFTVQSGSGTGSTCDTTITFNQPYSSAPKSIVLTPTTAVGSATVSTDARVSAVSTTGFTIQLDTPAASTNYSYYYWVVQ